MIGNSSLVRTVHMSMLMEVHSCTELFW